MQNSFAIGTSAPEFTAPDRSGTNISLQDFSEQWLVLYFYPKDNTPGCTTEAIDFTAKLTDFAALNAKIVGISPDSIAAHDKFITKHQLGITLLSDPEHQIAEDYRVWQLKKFMGKEYMGIVRSTFIIDPTGKIAQFWSNVRVKNHADTVLTQLQQLQQ
jgi:thioredoxin-dependent peroxiredoxin